MPKAPFCAGILALVIIGNLPIEAAELSCMRQFEYPGRWPRPSEAVIASWMVRILGLRTRIGSASDEGGSVGDRRAAAPARI